MLVRIQQKPMESSLSFTWRRARVNGLADARWLLSANAKGLHRRLGICVECVQSDQNDICIWEISEKLPICPSHKTWLLDQCPNCSVFFTINNLRTNACKCGHQIDLMRTCIDSSSLGEVDKVANAELDVIRWFGALAMFGLTGRPLRRSAKKSIRELSQLYAVGISVLERWPIGFSDLMDKIRLHPKEGAADSHLFNDAFPGLLRKLKSLNDQEWQRRLRSEIKNYVLASQGTSDPLCGKNTGVSNDLKYVASKFGLGWKKLNRHLNVADSVPRFNTKGGRKRFLTSDVSISELVEKAAEEISISQAAKLLNLSRNRLSILARMGLEVTAADPFYSKAKVLGLKTSLLKAAQASVRSPLDMIGWSELWRILIPHNRSIDFIQGILSRRIRVYGAGEPDLSKLQFLRSAIKTWLEEGDENFGSTCRRVKRGGGTIKDDALSSSDCPTSGQISNLYLSLPDLAKHLGLKEQVVYHLVKVGLIGVEVRREGRRPARFVSKENVDAFVQAVEPLARVASRYGVPLRAAPEWAKLHGLRLVSGPSVDGGRQYFVSCVPQ